MGEILKVGVGVVEILKRADKSVTKCDFAMVFFIKWGLGQGN